MGKYKRVTETRRETRIVNELIEIKWSKKTIKYYSDLGYVYNENENSFLCLSTDIHPKNVTKITVQCPVCLEFRKSINRNICISGHSICVNCVCINDLKGLVFGRLKVIDIDVNRDKDKGTRWVCECQCGEIKSIGTDALVAGDTVSCGCYNSEMARARNGENHPSWKGGEATLICKQCGSEYNRAACLVERSSFCSSACWGKWMSENWSGENNPSWNPETTREERLLSRNYPEYREYMKSVMERDNYTCCVCGRRGRKIQVHHLYSYSDYPEYRLDVNYGRVICEEEHKEFHLWMGHNRVPCTPKDFDIWLMTKKKTK